MVYEAITEGGITRFMAIYLHGGPAVIGPVRSARPHFIYLAEEYDPVFVHCGESYEALQILANNSPVRNLDQLKYGKPFWRGHTRTAPHDLYTSSARLRKFAAAKGGTTRRQHCLISATAGDSTGTPAREVMINFNGAVHYRLRFVYDQQPAGTGAL